MEYTKQLITKAIGKPCNICNTTITDDEAKACEFKYTLTNRRKDIFIHNKCWNGEHGRKVLP